MKKVISALFALLITLTLFGGELSSVTAVNSSPLPQITNLRITTANKKNLLKLTWDQQAGVDGVQIFRSSTGKSGTYEKIATIRNKNAYVDKDLKNSTVYFYKVRAFQNQNGNTIFGSFAKTNLSTKITSSYAKKKFNATIKFLENFYSSGTNFDEMIIKSHTDSYGSFDDPHYLFQYKGCQTKEQLKKHLTKYVSSKVADKILEDKFYVIDGKLYIWFPAMGAENAMVLSKTKISDCVFSDKKVSLRIGVFWKGTEGYSGADYDYINQTLVYENGRWVFGRETYMMDWIYPYW